MDDRRFDAVARRWAARPSRRTTVKAGTAALAAGLAAAFGGRGWAAECAESGQGCDRDRDCCNGAQCQDGKCRCRDGLSNCNGRCRDLQRDEDDCGSCGNRCGEGEGCQSGRCRNRKDIERDRCLVACLRDCGAIDPRTCPARCLSQCRNR